MTLDVKAYAKTLFERHPPCGDYIAFARTHLSKAESPLEELFLILWAYWHSHSGKPGQFTYAGEKVPWTDEPGPNAVFFDLSQQVKIGRHRADYVVTIQRRTGKALRIAIELDGHRFHDRTEQQASADRRRDRYFLREGVFTLRYTFSDLVKAPNDAMRDLTDTLLAVGKALLP